MARWLVCAFVLLQVFFLVLSEETTTTAAAASSPSSENPASVAGETTKLQSSVVPTRRTSKPGSSTEMPPLVHNPLNATEPTTNNTNSKNTEQKSAAHSIYNYNQIVMGSMLAAVLFASAI